MQLGASSTSRTWSSVKWNNGSNRVLLILVMEALDHVSKHRAATLSKLLLLAPLLESNAIGYSTIVLLDIVQP